MSEETKDCARLPVVAWWLKNSGGEKDLVGLGSGEHAYQGVYDEKIFLCRITDAQSLATDLRLELNAKRLKLCAALKERNDAKARLAEKDARIAQLAAHARGKNKALANALKEIERLKRTIETGLDNELALVGERTELRAQLEQLQSAPAERGVVVLKIGKRLAELLDEDQWAEIEPLLARLNQAPATADSDVREVKP